MAKQPDQYLTKEEQDELIKYLNGMPKPKPVAMSDTVRSFFFETVLPGLKDNALSELWRTDQVTPRLISYMDDTTIGVINLPNAIGGEWGDARSKDATARVHRFSARVPGVMYTTFVSEVWFLSREDKALPPKEELEREYKKGIADHPDRREGVLFNTLHFERSTGELMQLLHNIEVIKVLGVHRSRKVWRDTKWGDITMTIDPMAATESGPDRVLGRFIASDPDNDDSPIKS